MEIKILLESLDYSPETGVFKWRERPVDHFKNEHGKNIWNSRYQGKIAGTLHKPKNNVDYKRIKITICNKSMMAHQIAWRIIYGEIPNGLYIDHIDGDATNNSIKNLRLVTHSMNHRNRKIQSNNKSGTQGVRFQFNKWTARIKICGVEKYLGIFNTIDEAIAKRKSYAKEHGFTERH